MNNLKFEEITENHLSQVLEIYNYYVLNTTISFHTEALTLDEIKANVIHKNPKFKSYVIIEEEQLKGYVLLTQHKNKQAYDTTAEVTIYLVPGQAGKGLGSRALQFMEEVGRKNGFHTLVATICTENERSIALFEKHGFLKCAHFKEVGSKFGRWLDIASYQKILH